MACAVIAAAARRSAGLAMGLDIARLIRGGDRRRGVWDAMLTGAKGLLSDGSDPGSADFEKAEFAPTAIGSGAGVDARHVWHGTCEAMCDVARAQQRPSAS